MSSRSFLRELRPGPAARGFLSLIPGVRSLLPRRRAGGNDDAAYCYEVWMKHLTLLWEGGLRTMPGTLAELGPGDSLGLGIAALLCGVDRYYALDVVQFADVGRNLELLDELVALFRARAGRAAKGWPDYDAHLDERLFPGHILDDARLAQTLTDARIAAIRSALSEPNRSFEGVSLRYMVPWLDEHVIEEGSVDVIVSHSVLEHVTDLATTYTALRAWLRPGGVMSHQIDFRSHNLSRSWNGFRTYPEFLWRIITGSRPYLLNRQPVSVHLDHMTARGFELCRVMKRMPGGGVRREDLAARWRSLSDEDLGCSEVFVQARRPR